MVLRLFNRQTYVLREYVNICVRHQGKEYNERFYVGKNPLVDVLIGNPLLKKFKQDEGSFPIECYIKSPENKIVSWSRPIKNIQKRLGFQKEVERLLAEGKLEKSTSMWCHPVVITEKKLGGFRFTVDLTRLNP